MENIIVEKSKAFALKIIKLYKFLDTNHHIGVISTQILKSGTGIGANVRDAIRAQSKPDFYAKLNISLKEASETEYWLELLYESDYITKEQFESIHGDCEELIKILTAITKTQNK